MYIDQTTYLKGYEKRCIIFIRTGMIFS